jgi:hypothetical protein
VNDTVDAGYLLLTVLLANGPVQIKHDRVEEIENSNSGARWAIKVESEGDHYIVKAEQLD